MDNIEKFLSKLSQKELAIILGIMQKISNGEFVNLDTKKLKGEENIYRVRKGNIRIIFKKEGDKGKIINIDFRGNIYKKG
ncbi:MAG TPA: hypothetical protein P5060_00165 [Candidatus Absconditabacterales bacterium]|nr:hypothetical protein [Candidatus Absconditabacterales bacterium]